MNDTTFQGTGKVINVPVIVGKPQKQTNADRIRSKTDEELASWMTSVEIRIINRQPMLERPAMEKDWLDWLKQEVAE